MLVIVAGLGSNPFPSAFSGSGQLAALGNTNFANFRPQYTLPGGAGSSGTAASGEKNLIRIYFLKIGCSNLSI